MVIHIYNKAKRKGLCHGITPSFRLLHYVQAISIFEAVILYMEGILVVLSKVTPRSVMSPVFRL